MSDWIKGITLGKAAQYHNPAYPDWYIYEQAAGFFVWLEFRFYGKYASYEDAVAAVKEAAS